MDRKSAFALALACFVVALAIGTHTARAGESLPGLATPGKLVVGLDDTFAPMGFRDPAGNLVGFDIDLATAVGEEMGVEIVFQPIKWSAKEMELATRNIDCIWNGMSRTPEREENMTLSQDYLNNRLVIMLRKGTDIPNLDAIANYQIGTQSGSSGLEAIKKSSVYEKIKNNVHEYATYDECILDMRADRIQAMVVDEVLGNYKNNTMGNPFGFAPVDFGNDYYAIGFRRNAKDNSANDQLCDAVESAIQAIGASGKGAEISNKWFGTNLLLDIE